jgi:hypothetical protein
MGILLLLKNHLLYLELECPNNLLCALSGQNFGYTHFPGT